MRLSRKLRCSLWPLAAIVLLTGCQTARMDAPSGFAVFEDREDFVSTSPEGVVVRARVEENAPAQDLEFWREALSRNMIESGYLLINEGVFDGEVGEGAYFEWLAPVGEADWVYLTAIAVNEDVIAVVEGAGPHEYYTKHQDAILSSLETLRLTRSW